MEKHKPLISIIVNCYNGEQYLKEAIDSIHAQTYNNWEIIFVDNCSTDSSAEIVKSYEDERIKYHKTKKNIPLYAARNIAIDECNGQYIGFLDCDDIWIEDKLEKQIILAMDGHDIVFGRYQIFSLDFIMPLQPVRNLDKLPETCTTNDLLKSNPISIGCVMIKNTVLRKYRFNPYYQLLGDYDLWIRLSMDHEITLLDVIVEYSRQHNNNTSDLLLGNWLKERRFFYRSCLSFTNLFRYPMLAVYIIKTEIKGLIGSK
jgi:glycosyltransferase involved in cell wall biosynthesis